MRLETNSFLSALTEMYTDQQIAGAVRLQFKRFLGAEVARKKRKTSVQIPVCLARASNGVKNISTEVASNNHADFQNKIGTIVRNQLNACIKQDS